MLTNFYYFIRYSEKERATLHPVLIPDDLSGDKNDTPKTTTLNYEDKFKRIAYISLVIANL